MFDQTAPKEMCMNRACIEGVHITANLAHAICAIRYQISCDGKLVQETPGQNAHRYCQGTGKAVVWMSVDHLTL